MKFNPFSAAACTWPKTLLSLQVWALSAEGGQNLRAASCTPLPKKTAGFFGSLKPSGNAGGLVWCGDRRYFRTAFSSASFAASAFFSQSFPSTNRETMKETT